MMGFSESIGDFFGGVLGNWWSFLFDVITFVPRQLINVLKGFLGAFIPESFFSVLFWVFCIGFVLIIYNLVRRRRISFRL